MTHQDALIHTHTDFHGLEHVVSLKTWKQKRKVLTKNLNRRQRLPLTVL
jgi:hypothetical protein